MKNRTKPFSAKISILASLLFTGAFLLTGCSAEPTSGSTPTAAVPEVSGAVSNGFSDASGVSDSRNTIQVNSRENVRVVPDIAQVIYAVRTEAKDASSCQQQNAEDVNSVIELLKSLGIEETSIQTSDYYMYPIYDYRNNTQRITGYEATSSLTVSDLPIDDLGGILTQSVNAGINNIQSVSYQSSKYDEAYSDALKLAVASARTKAQALAEAGGCTLGNVVNINENSNYSEVRYTDNALSSRLQQKDLAAAANDSYQANIMPGEMDVEVAITVEYLIQ